MAQRRITAEAQSFPLARPFRISRGVKSVADVVMVRVEEDGIEGRGEGVPYPRYGETVEGSVRQIEGQRDLIESGAAGWICWPLCLRVQRETRSIARCGILNCASLAKAYLPN